jgi:hypothetical protein
MFRSHFTREVYITWFVALALLLSACGQVVADGDVLPMAVTSAQMVKDYAVLHGGDFVWFGPNGLQLYWRPLVDGVAWVIDQGGNVISARLSPTVCSGNYCSFSTFNSLIQSLRDNGWKVAIGAAPWWQVVGRWIYAGAARVAIVFESTLTLLIMPAYQPVGVPLFDGGIQ